MISTVAPFGATLRVLWATGSSCGIDDIGVSTATCLQELCATNNPKLTSVAPFGPTLRRLWADANSGIDDAGLANATRLEELHADGNPKISAATVAMVQRC